MDRRRHPLSLVCAGILAALVVVTGTVASVGLAAAPPAGAANWAPANDGDFPDPSILLWGGVYYGFATQSFAAPSQTINIQVSTSSNGLSWNPQTGVDALPHVGTWAQPGNTWAPSVAHDAAANDFVMYYTATERSTGDQCIGLATSSSPTGPYGDSQSQPMVCQNNVGYSAPTVDSAQNLGGSIDPDIFTDSSTGDIWLIWKSDGNHLNPPVPTILWSVRLDPTTYMPDSAPTKLMQNDQAWQSGIVEGPDMVADVDEHLHPLLLGEPRGCLHLRRRLGHLPLRSRRRVHRQVDRAATARLVPGHVGAGRS